MNHTISMGVKRASERLEALEERIVLLPDQQQLEDSDLSKIMDHDLYEATQKGDVEEFVDALDKVHKSRYITWLQISEQVTPSGNSLLHVGASSGNDDVVELILLHYPYLMSLKNSSEDTPLHVAVQHRRFNAIEKLIRLPKGLEIIYWKNKDSKSPLYLAAESEDSDILQLLLVASAQDKASAVKIQGKSPVLAALKADIIWPDPLEEIIKWLPKLLHVRDQNGGTPLHAAALVGINSQVRFLLSKCRYLALQTDKNGSYPIHIACEGRGCSTLPYLVEETWPDLAEIKNKKGQNILHVAAKAGNYDAVQHILKECVEPVIKKLVNSKDVDGNTPLHLASMHNHCEVMRSLTNDKRSDLKLLNNDGLTALDVAMESGSLSMKNPALLGRAILIVAGVRRSEGRDVLSPREQSSAVSKSSPAEWIKDQVNTLLLVATLVASVTFTAGVTLPGGYNASNDPHPGTATMLHRGVFQIFVIANMLAMYTSIVAVVVLLWGLSRDFYVAELAYHSAGPLLLMALTGMSVAFFAAVTTTVSKLTWLAFLVLSVGTLYLAMVIVVLAALIFPSSKSAMRIVIVYYLAVSAVREFVRSRVIRFSLIIAMICNRPLLDFN